MPRNNSRTRTKNCGGIVYEEGERELVAFQLNRLAREQLKCRLLADIQSDIMICRLEGWDYREYLIELRDLVDSFIKER